jgi:hypothetical protein
MSNVALNVVATADRIPADHGVRQYIPCHFMNQRQVLGAHHPQRAAHREVLDQRAPLIKLGVQIGDGDAGQPCPQQQVGGGRVGGMQPHEGRGGAVIESAGRSGLRKCRRARRVHRSARVKDRTAQELSSPRMDSRISASRSAAARWRASYCSSTVRPSGVSASSSEAPIAVP